MLGIRVSLVRRARRHCALPQPPVRKLDRLAVRLSGPRSAVRAEKDSAGAMFDYSLIYFSMRMLYFLKDCVGLERLGSTNMFHWPRSELIYRMVTGVQRNIKENKNL